MLLFQSGTGTCAGKRPQGRTPVFDCEKALSSQKSVLGRERSSASWCHPNSRLPPPLASWYGEGAVGVSAPAPPLSFLRAERGAFSAAPLSGDRLPGYCCGVFAVIRVDCIRFWKKSQAEKQRYVRPFRRRALQAAGSGDGPGGGVYDVAPVQIAPGETQHQHLRRGDVAGKGNVVLVAQP